MIPPPVWKPPILEYVEVSYDDDHQIVNYGGHLFRSDHVLIELVEEELVVTIILATDQGAEGCIQVPVTSCLFYAAQPIGHSNIGVPQIPRILN